MKSRAEYFRNYRKRRKDLSYIPDPHRSRAGRPRCTSNHTSNHKRDSDLRRRYNITLDDYNRLFQEQKGLCYLCGQAETMRRRGFISPLCVDHQHSNNIVRHLLCHRCNMALGFIEKHWSAKMFQYIQQRRLL